MRNRKQTPIWYVFLGSGIIILILPFLMLPASCFAAKVADISQSVASNFSYSTFYFAEGTCRPNFDPFFSIQNPNATDANVTITYMKGDGTTKTSSLIVAANSRTTVPVKNTLGEGDTPAYDFSAKVECTNGQGIVVERSVYFNYNGIYSGGHNVMGATSLAPNFYFAEGTCRPNFDSFLCIQNPDVAEADITITYMRGDGTTTTSNLTVDANSRTTVIVKNTLGEGDNAAYDFSAQVECTKGEGIVVERPQYFNYNGVYPGGHNVMGAASLGTTFYFAEGSCRPNIDPFLCMLNPNTTDADVTITYMKGDGTTTTSNLTLDANSRTTVPVKNTIGEGDSEAYDFSAKVQCTNGQGIVVERPQYFNYNGVYPGGHNVIGTASLGTTFYFAEGSCRPNIDPFLCMLNPNTTDADVTITYMKGDGTTTTSNLTLDANSRTTVPVKNTLGEGDSEAYDFSAKVECTNEQGIVVERPQYFNYNGVYPGGHNVIGLITNLVFADTGSFGFVAGSIDDKNITEFSDAGAGWLRPHVGYCIWGDIQEESASSFDFEEMDTMVRENQTQGFNILVTIWPYAEWDQLNRADPANYRVPDDDEFIDSLPRYRGNPVDWDAHETWLTAVVERYDGDGYNDMSGLKYPIRYWEVVNEPDINYGVVDPSLSFHMGEPEDYAELLKRSYPIIMAADTNAQVLIAAPAGNADAYLNYFRSVLNVSGATNSFHVANIHCISSGSPEDFNVADYKNMLDEYGLGGLPIWVTEADNVDGDDLTHNITLLEQSVAGAFTAGATKIFFTAAALSAETNGLPAETYVYTNIISQYE